MRVRNKKEIIMILLSNKKCAAYKFEDLLFLSFLLIIREIPGILFKSINVRPRAGLGAVVYPLNLMN